MIQDRLKIKDSSVISVFWLKNRHNTANGDFDWGWDGGDLIPETPSKNRWQEHLRSLYYPQNQKVTIYEFICIFLFTHITRSIVQYPSKRFKNNYAILKLAFIGAILYLLLFEGGRSLSNPVYAVLVLVISEWLAGIERDSKIQK